MGIVKCSRLPNQSGWLRMTEPTPVYRARCLPTTTAAASAPALTTSIIGDSTGVCILRTPVVHTATINIAGISAILRDVGVGALDLEVAHLLAVLTLDARHYHQALVDWLWVP